MISAGDLIAFVRACLDREEQVAREAHKNVWTAEDAGRHDDEFVIVPDHTPSGVAVAFGAKNAEHIAMHDPASVLADSAAKRAILDECVSALGKSAPGSNLNDLAWDVLRPLAQRYAGWDGWLEEWRL